MNHRAALLLALAASALHPAPALAATPAARPDLDRQIECAVVFAIVAGMQDQNAPEFSHFPAMDKPGEVFFFRTVERIQEERGVSQGEAIASIREYGSRMIETMASTDDPGAAMDGQMASCLPLFESIAPEAAPKDG